MKINNTAKQKENYQHALKVRSFDIERLRSRLRLAEKKVSLNEQVILSIAYDKKMSINDIIDTHLKYSNIDFKIKGGEVEHD